MACGLGGLVMAQEAAPVAASTEAAAVAESSGQRVGVRFPTPSVALWLGRPAAVVFHVDEPTAWDVELTARMVPSNARLAEVLGPVRVLAGARHGVVRLMPRRAGRTRLAVGGASVELVVKQPEARAGDAAVAALRPEIVTPFDAARVWGEVVGAVEVSEPDAVIPRFENDGLRGELRDLDEVGLDVRGRAAVRKIDDSDRSMLPQRTVFFAVDFDHAGAGEAVTLTPWREAGVGPSKGHGRLVGKPVTVVSVRPRGDQLIAGEAESLAEVDRPARFGDGKLNTAGHDSASGGRYVVNNGSRPAMSGKVEVASRGWYQLMLTTSADAGAGAWPTVGVRIDEQNDPVTASVVPGRGGVSGWVRTAIGKPFWLDPGERFVTAYFENDYYRRGRERTDRNLRIDRYELLRLNEVETIQHDHPAWPEDSTDWSPGDRAARRDLAVMSESVWHGRVVEGDIEVAARVDAMRYGRETVPTVTLEINGESVGEQRAWRPVFKVFRAQMREGENNMRLVARLDDGRVADSPAQTFLLTPWADRAVADADGADGHDAMTLPWHRRYPVAGPGWDERTVQLLRWHGDAYAMTAGLYSNGEVALALPDDLAGRFEIALDATGQDYEGPPIAALRVELACVDGGVGEGVGDGVSGDGDDHTVDADATIHVGEQAVRNGRRGVRYDPVDLPAGAKRLVVAFTNDHYGGSGDKDRNLLVHAITLTEDRGPDRRRPTARLTYPRAGAEQFGVDAVVAEVADDHGVAWAELLVDGEAVGMRVRGDAPNVGDPGRVVLPVLWRGVAPGEHTLSVRVSDRAGNRATSEPVRVTLTAQPPREPGPYASAVTLLERFAYGPAPRDLADVLVEGEAAYLRRRLTCGWDAATAAAWAQATLFDREDRNRSVIAQRATRFLINTPNPVRAKLTMFVENHFNTWSPKVEGYRKAAEFQRYVGLGAGPFGELLWSSATSPAMLRYLDQAGSRARRINENYAREIMELHSLGVYGGYTQDDVTTLAHVLAGQVYSDEAALNALPDRVTSRFRYEPALNDGKARAVFGLALPGGDGPALADRPRRVVEMLAAHPATARHVVQRLILYYLNVPAPERMAEEIADVFIATGGDLREVVVAIAEHPYSRQTDRHAAGATVGGDMTDTGATAGLGINRPLDHAVRLARVVGETAPWRVRNFLRGSGVEVFDRETPDGYSLDPAEYADSNTMLQRWRLARALEWRLFHAVPSVQRQPPKAPQAKPEADDGEAASRYEAELAAWRQRLIDSVAVRLSGWTLGPRSNAAAHEALRAILAATEDRNRRVLAIATFIAQLPEAQGRFTPARMHATPPIETRHADAAAAAD